ncbi:DUF1295 domain protein [Metarhizium robertsii]|uniref:3-oxo-5-alpha-steroid 4-dehydrogenase n=2 Tax=Metarhizium robertsii TaxID=568076 RepID=E9EPJ0_METRA|nr:3-oxo-5-alpha-steroid 4-dehydrogenase [Metarhizium robertsii ARSEF 23]EFZ02460.1 3-oxo-5-alpha-steroid 4-dehydrogenase [Metarhizium robertsii ARSEF 23]EXV05656.1 DUF1295 domain protein [Metarhizium robertsii]
MPIINRLLHITNFKSPLLRTIVPSVGAALAVQLAAGLPSVLASTERFFDISGSLTFLAVGALSLYLPHLRGRAGNATLSRLSASWNWRQVVVTGMAMAWAARRTSPPPFPPFPPQTCPYILFFNVSLSSCYAWASVANVRTVGAYLFRRISQDGHDPRFDSLRTKPLRFASAFFMQAVWVSVMLMPVMAVNAVPAAAFAAVPRLAVTDVLGIGVWAGGIALETAADVQKSRWVEGRRKKEHDEQFLKTGLFGMCRFPHYFGEISLWTGLATTCAGVLALKPIQLALGFRTPAGIVATTALSFVAPAFSGLLLTKVSGIPLTEARHDEKYGGRADYQEWKRNTPKLVPKLW